MAIAPYPIYAADITALSTPGAPVTVETSKSTKLDHPIAHGWLDSIEVEPGFTVGAARYDSYECYKINGNQDPGFGVGLNLGDGIRTDTPKRTLYVPTGNFHSQGVDEPAPARVHRGERKRQIRCGLFLRPEWIRAGSFERFDDTGIIARTAAQRSVFTTAAAPPALLSVAGRLFAAFDFDGPLARLRREAAALAFFAEVIATAEDMRQPRYASRIEVGRIKRVKEMLDSYPPEVEVRLVELAAHHGMSVRSLCRHFRQTFGQTVLRYVAKRRMEAARIALEGDSLTTDQAAYIAGFAHASNFTSAFRRRYGYSPITGRRR